MFDYGEAFAGLDISQRNPVITGQGWARDGTFYYFGPARMEGIDYPSFRILSPFQSADAHRKYAWTFPDSELAQRRKRFLEGPPPDPFRQGSGR